jgi:hypothetical protein
VAKRHTAYMRLPDVIDAARNPKLHDAGGIAASIDEFGVGELPLMDDRTGRLVAGHGRVNDWRRRVDAGEDPPDGIERDTDGVWLVPITRGWSSKSDRHAEAYLLASNRLGENGGWDHDGLTAMLDELDTADSALATLAGFTADAIADLRELAAPPDVDDVADRHGDPQPDALWPVVRIKVPHHVDAAWRKVVDEHEGDDVAALATLLDVDPQPPELPEWEPDRLRDPAAGSESADLGADV